MPVRRALAVACAAVLLTGCGLLPGGSDGTPRERFSEAIDDVRSAVEQEVTSAVAAPFTDPAAHGSGFERTRAFTDGYGDGPTACYPAPAQDWLVRR